MTTPPPPARLRELADQLDKMRRGIARALNAPDGDFTVIDDAIPECVAALRLWAGTGDDYDQPNTRQALIETLRLAHHRITLIEPYGMHGDILRRDAQRVIADLALAVGVVIDGPSSPAAFTLPDRSIVATRKSVYIKRIHGVGTPGFKSYWMAAESYAVGMDSVYIQGLLDSGEGCIVRVGEGW